MEHNIQNNGPKIELKYNKVHTDDQGRPSFLFCGV